jgi:hypothetical protein
MNDAPHGFLRPSATRILFTAGATLLALAALVELGRAAWWLKTGYWISLSFLDALDFVDVATSAWLAVQIGEIAWAGLQDLVWYTLAEAPLAGLLAVDGGVLVAMGRILRGR